jgi:hypothetical protein
VLKRTTRQFPPQSAFTQEAQNRYQCAPSMKLGREMWSSPEGNIDTGLQVELADLAAVTLMAADAGFMINLLFGELPDSLRSIATLALTPSLSLFLHESASYLTMVDPTADALLRPHRDLLERSRLRVKMLDDEKQSFDQILRNAEDLASIPSSWFQVRPRGFRSMLRALRQPDLGLFRIEGNLIATTHVLFLNMGLTRDAYFGASLSDNALGPFLFATSRDYGRYVGTLLPRLGIDVPSLLAPSEGPVPPVMYWDVKSRVFYWRMRKKVGGSQNALCIVLTWILSQLNTARVLARMVAGEHDLAAFKLGFISLYHAASSIQQILYRNQEQRILRSSVECAMSELLAEIPVQNVLKNKHLRNGLMHYRPPKYVVQRLQPSLPLFGLIEAYTGGQSLDQIAANVTQGLDLTAQTLSGTLPRLFEPGKIL